METTTAKRHADRASGSWATAEKYRKMAALAAELGLEYEVERMNAGAIEHDADGDYEAAEALRLGYDPSADE